MLPQLSCEYVYCPMLFQAVFIKRDLTWSGVNVGVCCNISATAPLTIGVAMLVPLRTKYLEAAPLPGATAYCGKAVSSVLPATRKETMRFPGATRSGFTM